MMPHRVALRVANFFCLVGPVMALVACTAELARKKPAEINLPKTGSPAAFAQIEKDLAGYGFGQEHKLTSAQCPACRAPDAITIKSTGLTKDIKGINGPANLRIVALINNGSGEDVDLTPASGTKQYTFKANTKYLMWAHSEGKKAIWGLIELGPAYDWHPKKIGSLDNCAHSTPYPPTPTDDADFKDCNWKSSASGWIKSAYASPLRPPALLGPASITSPTWISCDPDCCTGT